MNGLCAGRLGGVRVPNALAGQHLGGASAADPDSEEHHQQGGGEHHPAGVGRRVPDGQGKGHGPAQPCKNNDNV